MNLMLLSWQHFVGRVLRKDRVLQNSNDITVMSFLYQSQQNLVIFSKMLSCTVAPNLSEIGLFGVIFPFKDKTQIRIVDD